MELGKDAMSDAGCISSELLMCDGGVCSILFLSLVAICIKAIDICIWCMFLCLLK